METQSVVADAVPRGFDVYVRVRAWFFAMAFVAVRKQEILNLQNAIYASERILRFVMASFGGYTPPTSSFATAWASTIHGFAETIRVTGCTLTCLVLNRGLWEHKWQNYVEFQSSRSNSTPQNSGTPDLPKI